MDDFVPINLMESRNEWCHRLVSVLTPLIIEGFRSIFDESWQICVQNNETNKYLMTFQNLLSAIPKWNTLIVEEEKKRIIERSGCNYLEDLITCVHIIQLKVLTSIRVGNKQKKIEISIPKLEHFIHKAYSHAARKIYMNVYLFEKNVEDSLLVQRNNRELEVIVQEMIMVTIRESIPTEAIIRAYMDESIEEEEIISIEPIVVADDPLNPPPLLSSENSVSSDPASAIAAATSATAASATSESSPPPPPTVPSIVDLDDDKVVTTTKLCFSEMDEVLLGDNSIHKVKAITATPAAADGFRIIDSGNERIELSVEDLDGGGRSGGGGGRSAGEGEGSAATLLKDFIEELK